MTLTEQFSQDLKQACASAVVWWSRSGGGSIPRCGEIRSFFAVPWPPKCSSTRLYS